MRNFLPAFSIKGSPLLSQTLIDTQPLWAYKPHLLPKKHTPASCLKKIKKQSTAISVLGYVFFTEKIIHKLTNTKMYKHMGK